MSCWALKEQRAGHAYWRIHHGPSDALDNLPLYILRAEKNSRGPTRPVKRQLEYYSLAPITEGDCWYWSEPQPRPVQVKAGQVIAVGPRLLHAYGGHGQSYREDYVAFFGPVADRYRALGFFDPSRPLVTMPDPRRIGQIEAIVKPGSVEAQLRGGLLLQKILIESRFDAGHEATRFYPAIQSLLKRIADAPQVHLTNRQMASHCEMSESHFRKLFREEVGVAPKRYCESQRMERACDLLLRTNRRVQQIAAELGYDDPLYFSKRFSVVIGMSPRAYRLALRV